MSSPITTHVLDQLAGQPAGGMLVRLTVESVSPPGALGRQSNPTFGAATAEDSGRIVDWEALTPEPAAGADAQQDLAGFMRELRARGVESVDWRLSFKVESYWYMQRVESFYPAVDVRFKTDLASGREHWHVPLLLGPYGYTTYRGT